MSPRQYRSAEISNRSKMRSTRLDPSLDTALEAAAAKEGVSVNALIGTFVAEGLANWYSSQTPNLIGNVNMNSVSMMTSSHAVGSSSLADSVQNYPQTLATVRSAYQASDSYQDALDALSGKPASEEES